MKHSITIREIDQARQIFEEREPRDLFYKVATELIALATQDKTSLTVAEALAVLLQTWNRAYYQYRGRFSAEDFSTLECILSEQDPVLKDLRQRTIESLSAIDAPMVMRIFAIFEEPLGPVGAAKCLHLLAPRFFPLWDQSIARAYGLAIRNRGRNAERYYRFMEIAKEQWTDLGGVEAIGRNPLKAIDEYNYCKYTKHWNL
jgi:hypothetical protein